MYFFQANVCYLVSIKRVCIALLCLSIMSEVCKPNHVMKSLLLAFYSLSFHHLQNLNYFER